MDGFLGMTLDPLGERPSGKVDECETTVNISRSVVADHRYIAWLSLVALAYNYNIWFCTVRLAFPYHSPDTNMYWVACDVISDVVNLIDICVWQPRLQFVKGGDIIVSSTADLRCVPLRPWTLTLCWICLSSAAGPSFDQSALSEVVKIQGQRSKHSSTFELPSVGTNPARGASSAWRVMVFKRVPCWFFSCG